MDDLNKAADFPNEYTPLISTPRNLPFDPEEGDFPDAHSTSTSDLISYDICDGNNCACASSQPRSSSPHHSPQSATPDLALSNRSDVTAESSTDSRRPAMHRVWHVATYDIEYATWREMEDTLARRERSNNNSNEENSEPYQAQSRIGDGGTGSELALPEQMVWPRQPGADSSNAADSQSLNITCSVSRYAIKFPTRQDRSHSDTRPRKSVVVVESGLDEEEEDEAEA
ncbi:hypothetical protein G7Z17_g10902 [Cylindrodendrum hubeiense]|uniref:Uncharacterized protein n=1 Tax=Cylindrodendrum hubeiense TaxID=595255 RepID=A0A9P5LAS1_9HYPO|nr:hypothetical protein G7Z17_g10902 [Cylindrodendrum hubeiense]